MNIQHETFQRLARPGAGEIWVAHTGFLYRPDPEADETHPPYYTRHVKPDVAYVAIRYEHNETLPFPIPSGESILVLDPDAPTCKRAEINARFPNLHGHIWVLYEGKTGYIPRYFFREKGAH